MIGEELIEENTNLVESERFQLTRLLGSKLGRVGRGRGGSEGFLEKGTEKEKI